MIKSRPDFADPIENLAIGKIIEVNGIQIVADLNPDLLELSRIYAGDVYQIGQFGSIIKVHFGRRIIYAFVSRLRMKSEYEADIGRLPSISYDQRILEADLFGEAEWRYDDSQNDWKLEFERGVSTYPLPQQTIYLTSRSELKSIYEHGDTPSIEIGEHVSIGKSPCYADLNELLGKHTAVLGATGVGKSAAVASIIHNILDRKKVFEHDEWHPKIIILDPHNEYASAFTEHKRLSTDEGTLSLPYWLLNLDETINLLIGKTEYVATSQANIIKNALLEARKKSAETLELSTNRLTVDSPIPYKLGNPSNSDDFGKSADGTGNDGIVEEINLQRPSGQNKSNHESYNSVLNKLELLMNDERLSFMMKSWDGNFDPMTDILKQLIDNDSSVTIIDLSGVPNEIAGTVSAVIVRTLFSVKIWQTEEERHASPVLLVCEEAHRYIPDTGEAQYEMAQDAIRRIAKEGRKYGIGLFLVSQRPSEVEATVLSQCNSWIVLRITNGADKNYVHNILPDSMEGLTKTLSGLRRREAIFVGQAATLPSRVMLSELREDRLPRSDDIDFDKGWQSDVISINQLQQIAERWRYQRRQN